MRAGKAELLAELESAGERADSDEFTNEARPQPASGRSGMTWSDAENASEHRAVTTPAKEDDEGDESHRSGAERSVTGNECTEANKSGKKNSLRAFFVTCLSAARGVGRSSLRFAPSTERE
jgi:hypothetical protein